MKNFRRNTKPQILTVKNKKIKRKKTKERVKVNRREGKAQ